MATVGGVYMVTLRVIINKYIPKTPNHLISSYLVGNLRMKWMLVMKRHHFTIILLYSLMKIVIRCMELHFDEKCGLIKRYICLILWVLVFWILLVFIPNVSAT
jgi:hypothetical protein